MLFRLILPLLFVCPMAICATTQAFAKQTCTPAFPLRDRWQGADAAYSIPLKDGRDIWIFGDTLIGDQRKVENGTPRMVRNSIGVSTCSREGKWNLSYQIRKGADGQPGDFFTAQHLNTWYWALDGFTAGNELWVTLLCVRNIPKVTSQAFDFASCGSDLARVTDLDKDPQQWKVQYYPLVADGVAAYPSATAVVSDGFANIFALYEAGTRPNLVARIPLAGLKDPQKHLQYFSRQGVWRNGFDPKDAKPVIPSGNSELSVRYHPELKRWVAIMVDPTAFSNKVLMLEAAELTGPWTAGKAIYRIPEMDPAQRGYDKDTFCYAAKEHPEFEAKGELLFTYVCNTASVPKLELEKNIYFPQVVRMPMPRIEDVSTTPTSAR